MIYIIQGGRCGNQLFNYAFAKKIKNLYDSEKICFVLSSIKNKSSCMKNGDYWEDSLQYFNVEPYEVTYEENVVLKYGSTLQKLLYYIWRLSRKLNSIIFKITKVEFSALSLWINKIIYKYISMHGMYFITHGYDSTLHISRSKNKFIYGSFEDIRWFNDCYKDLIEELTPKYPISEDCKKMYNQIINCNAICVSLRKWEIDVHQKDELEKREICGTEYYKKALTNILEKINNPVVFVFSDDIDWAQGLIKSIVKDRCLVVAESGLDNVSEKLFVMSSCKHFIIANSTFSWWAAYLSKNKNKIVISPNIWFKSNKNFKPLVLDSWEKINCI